MGRESVGSMVGNLRTALLTGPYNNFAKHGSEILPAQQSWEGSWHQDLKIVDVAGTRYGFFAGSPGGQLHTIGYAVFTGYPYTWTVNPTPIITPIDRTGVTVILVSAPCVVPMPDGSFRLYCHEYSTINGVNADRGVYYTASASEFPNTWHFGGLYLDCGPGGSMDSKSVHNEVTIPPWQAIDGLWHHLWGALDDTSTWRSCHGTSTDGIVVTRDAKPFLDVDSLGKWDSLHKHIVGQPHRIGSVWYVPYQGWGGTHWQVSVCATVDFKIVSTHPNGPLVPYGTVGQFDEGWIENPACVIRDDGGVDLFPTCSMADGGTNGYKFGLARSPAWP